MWISKGLTSHSQRSCITRPKRYVDRYRKPRVLRVTPIAFLLCSLLPYHYDQTPEFYPSLHILFGHHNALLNRSKYLPSDRTLQKAEPSQGPPWTPGQPCPHAIGLYSLLIYENRVKHPDTHGCRFKDLNSIHSALAHCPEVGELELYFEECDTPPSISRCCDVRSCFQSEMHS